MKIPVETQLTVDCSAPRTISIVAVFACAWPALFLATVSLLPYLNKPFNVDDPWFLSIAQQVAKHPARPLDFRICWNDGQADRCRNAYQFASGNVLMGQVAQGYVLIPAVLGGAREWMAHLTQLVLVWVAVVAMTSLIFRFGWDRWHAITGALLLVAIPPFLPMASTAMPDILATAFTLVAIERLMAWKAERKGSQCLAAAITLGLAGLARPHLVLLLPLAAFFLLESTIPREILEQTRRELWLWVPVFAGCGLLLAIILGFREINVPIDRPPAVLVPRNLRNNFYTYLLYFSFPLPLAACWVANRLKAGRKAIVFSIFAIAATPWLLHWDLALILFLVVFGCSALVGLFFGALKMRDHTSLSLLLWILIPLPIVIYSHLPMKYLLPCMPAVILLCFRLAHVFSPKVIRIAATTLIVGSTAYSLLILHADVEFANFGRDALYHLIAPHVAEGERVWFFGQYWSYWYAPKAGANLTSIGGPQPRSGDLLVVHPLADGDLSPLADFPRRSLVENVSHKYRFGRTVGAGIGGLYSGFWLWGLGDRKPDRYELWRID